MSRRLLCAALLLALVAGCAGGGGSRPDSAQDGGAKSSGGRYAMESDAYPDEPPDVSDVPDAVPRVEPLAPSGNRPSYQVWGETYHVMSSAEGYQQQGTASWYGQKFQGYATASGEIYDMYKMSAAHRSLPLPTYARVTNLDNGRSVIVKVNDRGPFHGDRLIDLSYAAAARLDILGNGTGRVKVQAIDPVAWQARQASPRSQDQARGDASATGSVSPSQSQRGEQVAQAVSSPATGVSSGAAGGNDPRLYLQVAALGSATSAQALRARLQSSLDSPVRIDSDQRMHRVQVGPVSDPLALEALRKELQRAGYAQAFTVRAQE
ncbi:rare lipoprotein A [Modicisalibacter ilicicola DSM 19980]|uniref:Endolytic peptidoglycan transglycosylase RlpA n=1 Tax=Modicisalibacter ilicicola DSM 19980 TaxID=1121942 RepID=A0A1M5BTZ0_9GAMM|nr:septal ring lytic transglycosylase RlpA family protein [Halomonas ilicicola]SHF46044.1 rare lipoprotein A [Halomonas ilicicola DSM 19980]